MVFLFNPLLGPKLPISGGLVSAIGVVLLVACIFIGQAGMGKGRLFGRLPTLAWINIGSGVVLVAWSLLVNSFTRTAQIYVWVIAALLVALGVAQLVLGNRTKNQKPRSTLAQRQEAIRRK